MKQQTAAESNLPQPQTTRESNPAWPKSAAYVSGCRTINVAWAICCAHAWWADTTVSPYLGTTAYNHDVNGTAHLAPNPSLPGRSP